MSATRNTWFYEVEEKGEDTREEVPKYKIHKLQTFVGSSTLFLNSSLINIHDNGIPVIETLVNRNFLFTKYLLIETIY